VDGFGLGLLFEANLVKRFITSYAGENHNFEKMFLTGKIEVELTPQVRAIAIWTTTKP
jgi:acyl CoA:acetate/3-ketoacid CoA transferase alpha subunit